MKQIKILVGPRGATSEIETSGFTGESCRAASKKFEDLFGKVVSDEPTPEALELQQQFEGQ